MGQRCLGPCGPSTPAPVLLRPLAHLHWGHLRSRRARVSSSRPVSPPVSSAPREHRWRPSCSEAVPPGAEVVGVVGSPRACLCSLPPSSGTSRAANLLGSAVCSSSRQAGLNRSPGDQPASRGRCLQQSQTSRRFCRPLCPREGGNPLSRQEPAHRPGPGQLLWLLTALWLLGGGRGESQTPWQAPVVVSKASWSRSEPLAVLPRGVWQRSGSPAHWQGTQEAACSPGADAVLCCLWLSAPRFSSFMVTAVPPPAALLCPAQVPLVALPAAGAGRMALLPCWCVCLPVSFTLVFRRFLRAQGFLSLL